MEFFEPLKEWFWTESFWLPKNLTWKDFEKNDFQCIPSFSDLWVVFPMAVFLFAIRLLWERLVAQPIGRWYKLREVQPTPAKPNLILEKAFKTHGKNSPNHVLVQKYADQIQWTPRQVEYWWRRRRLQGKTSELQRFKETSWRFLFYFLAFWGGLYVLWGKSWFWDTRDCWYNYPKQHVSTEIWWYYMIELGFYLSLILSLFMDVRRKDFYQMIIHHIATIFLMVLSFSNNMVRIGALVLCVHDAVDYWMEAAKLAKYCRYEKLGDMLFVIFAVLWFVTRLVIFPFRVVKSASMESWEIIGPFGIYYVFNGLLILLQILHIIWFCMIMKMAYIFVCKGKLSKDTRSDTESEADYKDDEPEERYPESGKLAGGDRKFQTNGILQSNGENLTKRKNGTAS